MSVYGYLRKQYKGLLAERLVLDSNKDATPEYAPLYLWPTAEPTKKTAGAMYLDATSNELRVANGADFVSAGQRSPVVDLTAATRAVTAAESGTVFLLNRAAGIDVALPAITAADVGTRFRFVSVLAASSDTYTITAQSADLLIGRVLVQDTDTANTITSFAPDGTDDLIITFSDTADLPGSYVDLVAISATRWLVTGIIYHTGNSATPFS